MNLDTSGALLEGMRFSTGNNVYTFPPDNAIMDSGALNTMTDRAEYMIVADSTDLSKKELGIADSELVFRLSCNEPGIARFDYDNYSNRWRPLPGSAPRVVGVVSNDSRPTIAVPNPAKASVAPYDLYLDDTPRTSFTLSVIGSAPFTDPGLLPGRTVEVNESGALNFSFDIVSDFADKEVTYTGQNFTPRLNGKGDIGTLPDTATMSSSPDYRIFMNPRPASGNVPCIRIGYGPYLVAEEIATEALLSSPPSGTVRWSADTGRLKFAAEDAAVHVGETIYYDGIYIGMGQLTRYSVTVTGGTFFLAAAIGTIDSQRFVVFADKAGNARHYFSIVLGHGAPTSSPSSGSCYLDADTGIFYLSASDATNFATWVFGCVDALLMIGAPGVGVLMRRSGVNDSGPASVADFKVVYEVDQMLSDNLNSAPFMMLPTVPLVDGDLRFSVDLGIGSFVGDLADSADPTKKGPGYMLDLDLKRLKYTYRATPRAIRIKKNQAAVKLEGAALSSRGIEVKRDGVLLTTSDYDLDPTTGLVEFVEPVGEGEVTAVDVSGTASGNTFTATTTVFSDMDVSKRLLVSDGDDSGIYDIVSVKSSQEIVVSPSFAVAGQISASVRSTDEIIADRMWTPVTHVPKKFSLLRSSDGPSGVFDVVAVDKYVVKQNVGQVSLVRPTLPGEAVKINYTSLDSTDEGVTTTSTQRTEFALFKISQEVPTFAVGSRILVFNAAGKTVSLDRQMVVYVEGITQDSADYSFTAPGTITLKNAVEAGPVTIDYWVQEANGGETTIDLLHTPIDYDGLKVAGPVPGQAPGQSEIYVSGNQTSTLRPLAALLLEDQDMLYVVASSYDATTDLTKVTFNQPAVQDSTVIKVTGIINSTRPAGFFVVQAFSQPYLVPETNAVEIFTSGTNSVRIHTDVTVAYKAGIVIDLDGDPYWVRGSTYDSATDVTTVTTASGARRNYITSTVKRSIRPVLDASSEFSTSRPAHISRGFVLAKMGSSSSVLQEGVDYDLGDDGVIKLKTNISFGDVLRAMYVARVMQPAGTVFEFNFAHEIAPDETNGLAGQTFTAHYNLFAPDAFFYCVETVVSMLPDAKAAMMSSNSATPSGPNTTSMPSQKTKDAGLPSPWFDSRHYNNLDVVVQRFLLFYHQLIDLYENVLQFIDGRLVGGSSGRFRYDGVVGRVVTDNSQIANDIDDAAILYYDISMSFPPFSTVQTPVYGKMSDTNSLSRIFPTSKTGSAFIGDTTSATSGQQVGSFKINNIMSTGTTTTARSVAFFTSALPITGGIQFTIDASVDAPQVIKALVGEDVSDAGTNGDSASNTPPFVKDQKIQVFDWTGTVLLTEGTVGDIDPTYPFIVPVVGASTTEQIGSLVQTPANFDDGNPDNLQNRYAPGTDYLISADTGQIIFYKTLALVIPPTPPNHPLVGNEIIESSMVFGNANIKPERIPALDGKELNDSGRLMIPRMRLVCELVFLMKELDLMKFGFGKYSGTGLVLTDTTLSGSLNVGSPIQFVDGPNNGFSTIVTGTTGTTITLQAAPPMPNPSGSNFVVGQWSNFGSVLSNELTILNNELSVLESVMDMLGTVIRSGSGSATSTSVWEDSVGDLSGTDGMLLRVTNGASIGLYLIDSSAAHSVTLDTTYPPLVIGSGSYTIIEPWTFLKSVESQFVADFYRKTLTFRLATALWAASPSEADVVERVATIEQRQSDLQAVIGDSGTLTSLLRSGDNLYDTRYLWIDQRTNKENGFAQMQTKAFFRGVDLLVKTAEGQRKAFILDVIIQSM